MIDFGHSARNSGSWRRYFLRLADNMAGDGVLPPGAVEFVTAVGELETGGIVADPPWPGLERRARRLPNRDLAAVVGVFLSLRLNHDGAGQPKAATVLACVVDVLGAEVRRRGLHVASKV